jgi:hypothetical protein
MVVILWILFCSMCSWCLMLLVMQALAQLLVHSAALVRHPCWSSLSVVLVLLVLCLTSQVVTCYLMGGFLCQIHGYWDIRS